MAFRGWPPEALEFFEGLEADNSKAYWTAHKPVYDEKVHAPMMALLADLEPEFGAGKVFRPYRDIRFSADKSPYKTNIAAVVEDGGYARPVGNIDHGRGFSGRRARTRQMLASQSRPMTMSRIAWT